jgi:hypothetical protein
VANSKATNMNEFIIEYEYFGLSNSAEVKKRTWRSEPYYKCFLHSSAQEVDIMQEIEAGVSYWVDMSAGSTTPLSQILGALLKIN